MSDTDQGHGQVNVKTGPDAGTTRYKEHETGLLDAMKSYVQGESKAPGGTMQGDSKPSSTDEAVDRMSQAIKTVPGNSADYG